MITEQFIRDIWEVHSRLFDHRPILQGHIHAFAKEFEEKRGTREQDRLNKIEDQLNDMNDKYLPETEVALDTFLTSIQAKVRVAIDVCKKIEEKENNVEVGYLDVQREKRKQTWDVFMQEQFEKSANVDKDNDVEIKNVSEEYAELEKKIQHISTVTN